MKTGLKRLAVITTASALLVGGFAGAASATVSVTAGKKPSVAINEYKSAKAEFKATMKVYIAGHKQGMADYRAALAAWKAANQAYLSALKSVNDAYRTAVKSAWRTAEAVLESETATADEKAAAKAAFAAAKAAAVITRNNALAALTPIGTPPVKPAKIENPSKDDDTKVVEDPKKKNLNEKKNSNS